MADQIPLEQWFWEMPLLTRWWTSSAIACAVLVQCRILSPFNLFYSYRAVMKGQYWRLFTPFIYFGPLSLDLLFHVFFLARYSRLIEESSGRSPAHYSYMLAFAAAFLLCLAPLFSITFLGSAASSTMVYVWSRRNPDTLLSFFGLLVFRAPWLPWVLMAVSVAMHGIIPRDEICGVVVGHVWYYFNDIYPPTHNGHRPLDPPGWWVRLWEDRPAETEVDDVQHDVAVAAAPVPAAEVR
ncbi:DER1-domain-containing protein [Trichodelitschia bisporula]|uniref:Derlin n=1 Tax=Trichodelitschia bisporula TaxID=703511 RepID=A0A6G1I7Y8_9PEZI|nr:DER1-domain-containing protein [Trichodelitschia bisporula]